MHKAIYVLNQWMACPSIKLQLLNSKLYTYLLNHRMVKQLYAQGYLLNQRMASLSIKLTVNSKLYTYLLNQQMAKLQYCMHKAIY